MKVIILTEGGGNGGLGHILRCISISQAFAEMGIRPKLIINGDESPRKVLREKNFQIFNWLKEKKHLTGFVRQADIVIIDSYLGDIDVYKRISGLVKVPVYIDDNKRLDYPRGIVINSGIHAKKLKYPKRPHVQYLLGNQFAPLRKLFWDAEKKVTQENLKGVMVTTGGNDPHNIMPRIVGFLERHYPDLKKNIIIGNAFGNIDQIKREADKNTNLVYFPDGKKMKDIMLRSDVAISSGGQTLYELARMGVPTIAFCQSENQRLNCEGWAREGFIEYAGGYNNSEKKISQGLNKLLLKKERMRRSGIGMKLVDGQGARKIAAALLEHSNLYK